MGSGTDVCTFVGSCKAKVPPNVDSLLETAEPDDISRVFLAQSAAMISICLPLQYIEQS